MAKIAFSKLGLAKKVNLNEIKWNDQKIEIKDFIPTEEKLMIIAEIVALSADAQVFYNPCKLKIFEELKIIFSYSNITITDKQGEDASKLYDLFLTSGLLKEILDLVPQSEKDFIHIGVEETIKQIYAYKNSAMGIVQQINEEAKNMDVDFNKVMETVKNNSKQIEDIKTIATKLD